MTGPTPRPELRSMRPYGIGGPRDPGLLRLDGNEGPLPPAAAGLPAECLQRYPDQLPLRTLLAQRFGLPVDGVVLGTGADELLDRACRAYLWPGSALLLPVPAFIMLERYVALAGAEAQRVAWLQGPLPRAELLAAITRSTRVIAITSPNNPTGAACTADDLRALSAAAPEALLLCDFAYAEFGAEDLTAAALQLHNTIVLRTFSKAYGLAGLRVGYALGRPELLAPLMVFSPYAVAGPSLTLAEAALQRGVDEPALARVCHERQQLAAQLAAAGAQVLPSQANFVTAFFADAAAVARGLLQRGIAVRAFPGDARLGAALRITCPGDDAAFARLTAALGAVLAAGSNDNPGAEP